MANLERKKYKRLGINFLILIVSFAQMLVVTGVSHSKPFVQGNYPLVYISDTYLLISSLTDPILISSLVKKVIEIGKKNKMQQLQVSLGEKVSSIPINKFKNLSLKLVLLQIVEVIVFLLLAKKSGHFNMDTDMILRFALVNISAILINLFFMGLFMIIEVKSRRVYTLSFIGIIGGLTGVITMLTSETLAFVNPFAWIASLLNIPYITEGGKFIQVLNPINSYTPITALILLIACLGHLKTMETCNLHED